MTETRPRPRTLPSSTTKLSTEMGNLYVTVSTDEDGTPFEVCWQSAQVGQIRTREDYYYEELRGSSLRVLL